MSDSEVEYDISNAITSFHEASSSSGSDSETQSDKVNGKPGSSRQRALASITSETELSGTSSGRNVSRNDDSSDDEDFFNNLQAPSSVPPGALGQKRKVNPGKFNALGLSTALLKAVHRKGYNTPTPIQRKTIPLVLEGLDVVGMARTGSGKTAAFVLPMIERLKTHSAKVGARAIILSPSRELALQTLKVVKDFSKGTDLKSVLLVGGDSLEDQFGWVLANPDIIIATPGRFAHLKVEMDLDLRSVEYIVFDEADRLFELGFAMQLTSILASLPASRQTLLFSATLPKSLVEFARAGLIDPVLIRLDADAKVSDELEMFFFSVKTAEVDGALVWLLREVIKMPIATEMPQRQENWNYDGSDADSDNDVHSEDGNTKMEKKKFKKDIKKKLTTRAPQQNELTSPHSTIVFAPTRHHVEYVTGLLRTFGYAVSYIYGSLDQHARRDQLAQFRSGFTSILVVTDVAARGIDIPILSNVINYAFPGSPKIFVHRVGRTARAGKRGRAFSLVKESEVPYLLDLELFLGKSLLLPTQAQNTGPDEIDYTASIVVGGFPRDDLERSCEDVQSVLAKDFDLFTVKQVSIKGEKLYLKTRGSASMESVRRAKEVIAKGWDSLNPLFKMHNLAEREHMLERLANFRPAETIFELTRKGGVAAESGADLMRRRRTQVAPIQQHAKEKGTIRTRPDVGIDQTDLKDNNFDGDNGNIEENTGADLSSVSEADLLSTFKLASKGSKRKRRSAIDGDVAPSKKAKKTSFKDDAHYISHYAPAEIAQDRAYGVNPGNSTSVTSFMDVAPSATFDLIADEQPRQSTGIIGSNRSKFTKWDKKRGKYVTKQTGDEATMGGKKGKMIRGENGVRLPSSYKSGRFESWKQANRKNGQRVGDMENVADSGQSMPPSRRFKHKLVKAPKPADRLRDDYKQRSKRIKEAQEKGVVKNKRTASELKSTTDIRKMRKLKEKRREKNARPSRKTKK
ncbi:P-loop containing nucleoside triphosphate hydrolase protein [Lipomyces tetrasporus]|uniref:ATP-dependent RNA helicase DBP10 n=1 Tax=Lipomyces tetrasporus TaxID=54092 RepID=A0AAD7QSP6_9ASCO|nr:P-loop containing nucleoside triphosphate hydrolase protein [Lipomyces tetrasporus]KAJ8100730.1 P-loop containing nucleoside triphosphate hydrolase protein [Lipomyces tetrasporus]